MKYTVIIEKAPPVTAPTSPTSQGFVPAGEAREEAISLITKAVKDQIELMAKNGNMVPEPTFVHHRGGSSHP